LIISGKSYAEANKSEAMAANKGIAAPSNKVAGMILQFNFLSIN
jgi:hypothetical protein